MVFLGSAELRNPKRPFESCEAVMFPFCSCTVQGQGNNGYKDKSFLYLKKNTRYIKIKLQLLVSNKTLNLKKSQQNLKTILRKHIRGTLR